MPRALLRSCGTVACHRYASFFLGQLNRSVDPCDDLRAFSCASRPKWRHSLKDELVENASRAALANFAATRHGKHSAVAKTSTFYRTCVSSKTPLDLQSLRAFLADAAADAEPAGPDSSTPFQVMSKMAARYGNGILFRLGTGFVPESGSRIERSALVLGLNRDFRGWMQKVSHNTGNDSDLRNIKRVLSLSMSRDDFVWRNVSADIMEVLQTLKDIWRSRTVGSSQAPALTTVSEMGAGLLNIKPAILFTQLQLRGASYSKEHLVMLEQGGLLFFLDSVLERVDQRQLVEYLIWETARQMSTFFLRTHAARLEHACYTRVVKLFGSAAVLMPVIWHQVSAEAVVSAEATFASVLKASEDAVHAVEARTIDESRRLTALGHRLRQVRLVISYPEDVREQQALNEKLAHVPAMGDVFFDNFLTALESSWNHKKERPALPAPLRPRPRYDALRNELVLPIDFLVPPWFSLDSPPYTRLATVGLSLSLTLWQAVSSRNVYDVGESSWRFLSQLHGSKLTCLPGTEMNGLEDAFRRVAVVVVANALRQILTSGNSSSNGSAGFSDRLTEDVREDLELLLVACCVSTCGPRNHGICAAVMKAPQFQYVFRCTQKEDVDREKCSSR
ncbi:hypothetical protein V5799_011604 [Amblyomma americanum]|uniref:Uncharacterized protein n=1 Tax=Amblyomma americanum TaxID=6943 RepID=A0AAQ4EGS5_AMBAM